MQSKLKSALKNGETVIGTFQVEIASPAIPEICAHAGFDFVIIDTEHAPIDFQTVIECIRSAKAAGISSIVRVWENRQGLITRILDSSPDGIMVPSVSTPEEAAEVVCYCKYAPDGMRGVAPMSRYSLYENWFHDENERLLVSVQIEGIKAVERASEIMAVPGIDMGFVGPYDLSQSLGIPGQLRNPKLVEQVKKVVASKPDGRVVGIYAGDLPMARQWINAGVQFVAIQLDSMIFRDAAKNIVTALRSRSFTD